MPKIYCVRPFSTHLAQIVTELLSYEEGRNLPEISRECVHYQRCCLEVSMFQSGGSHSGLVSERNVGWFITNTILPIDVCIWTVERHRMIPCRPLLMWFLAYLSYSSQTSSARTLCSPFLSTQMSDPSEPCVSMFPTCLGIRLRIMDHCLDCYLKFCLYNRSCISPNLLTASA